MLFRLPFCTSRKSNAPPAGENTNKRKNTHDSSHTHILLTSQNAYATLKVERMTNTMDNNEYIKSLEERIQKLEEFLSALKFDESNNISITNCTLPAIGMEKCKNITISNITAGNLGIASCKTNISHSTIESLDTKSAKVNIAYCTINDKKETE